MLCGLNSCWIYWWNSSCFQCCQTVQFLTLFENLTPHFFSCFQLILWEFWKIDLSVLGISLCYNIIHNTIFLFSICFLPPSFFHPSYVHPFSYSDNCLRLSLVLFLKGFPFLSLPVSLLPQNPVLTEVPVCPVIPCTKTPYSLRTECYRCSKRDCGLPIYFFYFLF